MTPQEKVQELLLAKIEESGDNGCSLADLLRAYQDWLAANSETAKGFPALTLPDIEKIVAELEDAGGIMYNASGLIQMSVDDDDREEPQGGHMDDYVS